MTDNHKNQPERTRERENDQQNSEETKEANTEEKQDGNEIEKCPECDGRLSDQHQQGEVICEDCGLVVDEMNIDRGPEWRAFDSAERDEKSRVGAPTTNMMHDKGLSTNIDWKNKDAYGRSISSEQRKKMQRLRKWNERFRTRDARERNLKQALGEIDRMSSALGIPQSVRETASVIYRRSLKEDLLPGRSIEGMSSAALYAAIRKSGVPRSLDDIVQVSRVDENEIARSYRYTVRELSLEVQPPDPVQYVPQYISQMELSDQVERIAVDLLEDAKEEALHSGKHPVGMAAAAIYAAALLANQKITQSEVSAATDVSEVTIRNRYQEILEVTTL